MINPEKINLIRNNINIVDIVGQYLSLNKKGRNFWVVCPFHKDNNPSMSVSTEKQIYHCFSCQASGNVFTFLQEYKNISFLEAVKELAKIANVELTELNNYQKNKYDEKTLKIFEINALAKEYFMAYLQTSDGIKAKEYLIQRQIDETLIEKFSIGLAPKNNALLLYFQEKGYEVYDLLLSGLISEQDNKFNDYFHNRIMFPIYDLDNNIVGFSSRVYQPNRNPKYLNTGETKYFQKKTILYNLNQAQHFLKKTPFLIICEGFMDVISLAKIDINNVIALMGTNLTAEQQQLLKKHTNNIVLFLDGDEAGINSTLRLILILWKAKFNVQIVKNLENCDPDDLVTKQEPSFIHSLIKNCCHPLEFILFYYTTKVDFTEIQQVNNFIQQITPFYQMLSDPLEINFYLNKLQVLTSLDLKILSAKIFSQNNSLDRNSLLVDSEYRQPIMQLEKKVLKPRVLTNSRKWETLNAQELIFDSTEKAENIILLAAIKDKNVLLKEQPFYLINENKTTILELIIDWYENNPQSTEVNLEKFILSLQDETLKHFLKMLLHKFPLEDLIVNDEFINDCQEKIYDRLVQKEIEQLKQKQLQATDYSQKLILADKIIKLQLMRQERKTKKSLREEKEWY